MNGDDNDNSLSADDRALWRSYIGDEEDAACDKSFAELLDGPAKTPDNKSPPPANKKQPHSLEYKTRTGRELDRRTDEKLRKGKLVIEARCDLHGLRQDEAHERLRHFVTSSVKAGKRCVLVITGKGKSRLATDSIIEPEKGVLKQRVPEWLDGQQLKPHILKYYSAQPKDGGSGALYLYLRRKR